MTRAVAGTSIALVVSLAFGTGGPVFADDLEDRKSALENEIAEVQQSIEYLDEDITRTIAQLRVYQDQLPAAQQALADAQTRVETATNAVSALSQRVALAQETRNKITAQLEQDKAKMDETRKVIGQIATQAYKNGGVPSSVSLILGSEGAGSLTESIDMVDQALRSQNAAMDSLSQQSATNANSEARLVAVEEEIRDLKSQAEEALAAEQDARDEAASEKSTVDKLIADTSALSAKLQEQKPAIEAELAKVEEAHVQVTDDIAERQAKLLEEARKREEAELLAEAEERARIENERRGAPQAVAPALEPPSSGSPLAFGLRTPVDAEISSGFGWRPTPNGSIDFNGTGGYTHTGIDYAVGCGTALYAPAAGEVWYADTDVISGAGKRIVLNHGVVDKNVLATNYYHLSSYKVFPGQRVSAGQLIGYTGTTGNSTGCHLHFETVLNGSLVDPMGLI